MRPRKQVPQESKTKVPAYIVTFSDMVTLLLTFFVMLISLARMQDPELFNIGRNSFVESIRGLGLGLLFGSSESVNFGYMMQKYTIKNPEDSLRTRTIDAKQEKIRRVFVKVRRSMKAIPSQIVGQRADFPATDIRFSKASVTLNARARKYLTEFCTNLKQNNTSEFLKLYVLGLSNEGLDDRDEWILSAQRAKTVADFMSKEFSKKPGWSVYSWGAGPGDLWTSQESPLSKDLQILIAILRE